MAEEDLDAEFALFEQEIGGLDDEPPSTEGESAAVQVLADAPPNSRPPDVVSHFPQAAAPPRTSLPNERKRPLPAAYSSAPVFNTSAQDTSAPVSPLFAAQFSVRPAVP